MFKLQFTALLLVLVLLAAGGTDALRRKRDAIPRLDPKIITSDGNLNFQSATNKNITFQLDGNSDVWFGQLSLADLKKTIDQQAKDIAQLQRVQPNACDSRKLLCSEHGICINTHPSQSSGAGFKCLCQPGYTGATCNTTTSVCDSYNCQNGGRCSVEKGKPHCVCQNGWFGKHCYFPRPKNCQFHVTTDVGVINSPGYPDGYPDNINCTWILKAKPGRIIRFVTAMISIGPSTECDSDFVQISSVLNNNVLCGFPQPRTIYTQTSEANVTFVSGGTPYGHGFSIFFAEVNTELCGGTITSAEGEIKSPEGQKSVYCTWVIDVKTKENFNISFQELYINNDQNRCDNYLEIGIGNGSSSQQYKKYCHQRSSNIFEVVASSMITVRFVSNGKTGSRFRSSYEIVCGGNYHLTLDTALKIRSPLFPLTYSKNKQCTWLLISPPQTYLTIHFENFEMEHHSTCSYDYVSLYNGGNAGSVMLGQYCGNKIPLPVSSSMNKMMIMFSTDRAGEFKGFTASVTVTAGGCGGTFVDSKGQISSPSHPAFYSPNSMCIYTLTAVDVSMVVQLSFTMFSLEENKDCTNDYIKMYDGDSTNRQVLYANNGTDGRFCGTNKPPVTISSGRSLTLVFQSNSINAALGFSADWLTFVKPTGCDVYKASSNGEISSPYYPNFYSPMSNCKYTIKARDGHVIKLSFNVFSLEDVLDCTKDYLKIYNGEDEKSPLIGTFCGDRSPGVILSKGNFLFMVFKSDLSSEHKGFHSVYETGTNLCGGTLHGKSGFIISPNYPVQYPANYQCTWEIVAAVGNNIQLTVEDFLLESSPNCEEDSLVIYDVGMMFHKQLCGNMRNKVFTSKGNKMILVFKSDASLQEKGFRLHYKTGCGGVLDSRTGTIRSPNFPNEYPVQRSCNWTINGNINDVILLNFITFDLEYSENCQSDYLLVTEPGTGNYHGKYCGMNRTQITSTGHQLFLKFKSDNFNPGVGKGFLLNYTIKGCSQDFFLENGTFTTPNYPNTYPSKSYCKWRIRSSINKKIRLTLSNLSLEHDCHYDNLTIFNGYGINHPVLGRYCSRRGDITLESSSNEMTVLFISDALTNGRGFSAKYDTISGGCSKMHIAHSGNIYSPGFPENYPPKSECKYTIQVPATRNVNLTFKSFDIESNANCSYDYVSIWDDVQNVLLGKFCGRQIPPSVISMGNKIIVTLYSDSATTGKGFEASFNIACGGSIAVDSNTGFITSPHYPSYYTTGTCIWVLTAQPGQQVSLTFHDIQLERCRGCSCDYVEVHNGRNNNSALIGKYCGDSIPHSVTSSGNVLHVKFHADRSIQHIGFKASYTSLNAACGGEITGFQGKIASPLYPLSAPASTECVWKISVSEGSTVSLSFMDFHLVSSPNCSNAYIQVYDGPTSSSPSLSKVCGNTIPLTISSSSNVISVQFYSGGISSQSGNAETQINLFKAAFRTNCLQQTLTANSGYIASPNYPRAYPPVSFCRWRIVAPQGASIQIEFEDMEMEEKYRNRCTDVLTIRDGSFSGELLGSHCGLATPAVVTSTSNIVSISFQSDSSLEAKGFRLKYTQTANPTVCGGVLSAGLQFKSFTTHNYPSEYPPNQNCEWVINAPIGQTVVLKFGDFMIEADTGCAYDAVRIFDRSASGRTLITPPLCGNLGANRTYYSSTSTMIVKLESDGSLQEKGFTASYKAGCGGVLTSSKGKITSGLTSASQYLNNQNCEWKIILTPGSKIKIIFTKFNLESSDRCSKDYVVVKNGILPDSTVIGRYCGNRMPNNVTSSGNEVTVQFVTDGQNVEEGFEIVYEMFVAGCGGKETLSDPALTYEITSPEYPAPFPSNVECIWTLEVPAGHIIDLTFSDFNISSSSFSTTCLQGSVLVQTGVSPNEKVFGPYCGLNSPSGLTFKSSSNIMVVTFVSFLSNGIDRGFKASWRIGCGGYMYGTSGKISSPLYPSLYPNNQDCMYIIEIPTKQQVHLSFNTFSLEPNPQCLDRGDFLEVLNDDKNLTVIARYCGSSLPKPVVSAGHTMRVRFHSNSNRSSNGFEAMFTTVGTGCGGQLFFLGTFASPFYPQPYPLNRVCTWLLVATPTSAIQINFTDFHLEASTNCTNDYVEIRNGPTVEGPLLGRYCGAQQPPLIKSSGSRMLVTFFSNRNPNRGKGFKALFISTSEGCGGKLSGSNGSISSPNYPANYDNAAYCEWTISVAKDKTVHLHIRDLLIEPHSLCAFDGLKVFDGPSVSGRLLANLCGNITGRTYSSVSGSITVVFSSDSGISGKGFYATWTEGEAQCGGELLSTSSEIVSPMYPSYYGSDTDCVWLIKLPDGMLVHLNVVELSMPTSANCAGDHLIIQNGLSPNSPVLATLCGNTTDLVNTSWISASNHMRLHLKSPATASPYGRFKLSYVAKPEGCGGKVTGSSGVITSPGYPSSYQNNLDCEWIIETEPGTSVFVHIEDLDMEVHSRCIHDYIEVWDHLAAGSLTSSPNETLLARLCGKTHESVYHSSQNKMRLRFRTDQSNGGRGFKVAFNTGCGGLLRGRSGYAISPNYPNTYPNNQDCRWVIDLQPHYHIRMTENDFNLPSTNGRGECRDFVELREGTNVTSPRIAKFCGQNQPPAYQSNYHQLFVRFVSDNITQPLVGGRSWRAKTHYAAVCGETIKNSLFGVIKMPQYTDNENCVWVIEFPVGKQISLRTKSFDLEYGGMSCMYDYVEIRDGADKSAPLFGKFCGSAKPPRFRSTGNSLYIRFVSDKSAVGDGFQFEYSEAPIACGGILNGTFGEVTSPLYPNNIPVGETCGWQIIVPEGKRINLTFTDFSIPYLGSSDFPICTSYVNIYDAAYPDHHYQIKSRLCGFTLPPSLRSTGNTLYLLLHASILSGRFRAEYKAVTAECGGVLEVDRTVKQLKSPNYPLPFSAGRECDWMLRAQEGNQVSVVIKDLSLPGKNASGKCGSTHLLIMDGTINEDSHIICGNTSIKFVSSSHAMKVVLIRNSSAKGFLLEYTSISGCNKTYTASSGLVTSSNHPLNYQKNSNCYYIIKAPIGHTISLYPISLSTEETPRCQFDYLRFYDGASESNTLMKNGTYCGKELPPTLHSSGDTLLIKFVTDASITRPGFAITYTTSSAVCGGLVTGYKGSLTSPHFPMLYSNQYTCEWNITVSPGKRIRLNVTHFEMEDPINGADCLTVDYLQFAERGNILATYCGLIHPAPRTSTSNSVRVIFRSNNVNNDYRGFQLFYNEVY